MTFQSVGRSWELAGTLTQVQSHSAILIRKADILSPHLAAAQQSQHVLERVTIFLVSGDIATLYNVRVQEGPQSAKHAQSLNSTELEQWQFTFRKIELEHKDGKTMGSDSWSAGA